MLDVFINEIYSYRGRLIIFFFHNGITSSGDGERVEFSLPVRNNPAVDVRLSKPTKDALRSSLDILLAIPIISAKQKIY